MSKTSFSFIDLFAGIGGIRIPFEELGGTVVFSSEYDPFAQKTYEAFFRESPDFSEILETNPAGDITKLSPGLIPDHDILTGGFPCQPFSLAGVSKKQSLGREHGFRDLTQGTLFFNIQEILRVKRPKAFLLENVKNLISHDKKRTFATILQVLDELNYSVFYRLIDAAKWGPQHRERIYIVGFRRPDKNQNWEISEFPELEEIKPPKQPTSLEEILEKTVPEKYTLGPGTWNTLVRHKANHEKKGNGFGYGMVKEPYSNARTRTLSARYHKDGAEILIRQNNKRPRRLTPLECSRLMGFPEKYQKYFSNSKEFPQPVSDTQAYRQFGNSVYVPVVREVAKEMINKLVSVGAI